MSLVVENREGPTGVAPLAPVVSLASHGGGAQLPDDHGREAAGGQPARSVHRSQRWMIVGAALAAAMTAAMAEGFAFEAGLVSFVVYAVAGLTVPRPSRHVALLSFTSALLRALFAAVGSGVLVAADAMFGFPGLTWSELALVTAAVALPAIAAGARKSRGRRRVAVIGSPAAAEMLARELVVADISGFEFVGVIPLNGAPHQEGLRVLGGLSELGTVVERDRIDLLLMSGDAPRLAVFDEIARSCLHLPVRLWELSGFYEEVFGHVPVAEINTSWFQYIMHPRFRSGGGARKRALDLVVASIVGLLAAPVLGLLALIIRRDGGPVLFHQERIGEGGRVFTIHKLRTMRVAAPADAQWSSAGDDRVTRIGRFLRRTHLDELPQIANVLRGEMSLVGPRPEQPAFVQQLEETVPFYSRRHLIKPGLTGWAQVRCGYAGSDLGSAWKVCHDLYYLKHRSFGLDLAILVETVRTLVADPQYELAPSGISFILRPAPQDAGTVAAV